MVSKTARTAQLVVYGVSTALMGLVFVVLWHDSVNPVATAYGSHFIYLTIIGLSIALLGQSIGLAAAITGNSALYVLKDKVNLIAGPLEFLISLLYWGIKAVDPMLLLDPNIQMQLPLWLDLCMHALPAISNLIDVLVWAQTWTLNLVQMVPVFGAFGVGYWYWVHHTFDKNGFFPYPLLALATTAQRAQIFAASVLLVSFTYEGVRRIQISMRHGAHKAKHEAEKVKQKTL